MTLFTTILAGVTVFVLGQIVLKWMIEPIQELRKLKGEILFHLANDHATIHNAKTVEKETALEVGRTLERLGASLLANQHLIPMYSRIQRVFQLPDREKIQFAAKRLRLISNSIFGDEHDIHYKLDLYRMDVCEALDIEDPIKDGMTREQLSDAIREMRNQSHA
jgi:hypothetical protein